MSGVCAGFADHLGIDVVIVRILTVVLTIITSGLVVFVYLGALLFIPSASPDDPGSVAEASADGTGRDPLFWLGVGLLVVGALWVMGGPVVGSGATGGIRQLFVPPVLIGFGLALWRAGDRPAAPASSSAQPPVWDAPPPPPPARRSDPTTMVPPSPTASSTTQPPTTEPDMHARAVFESDHDALAGISTGGEPSSEGFRAAATDPSGPTTPTGPPRSTDPAGPFGPSGPSGTWPAGGQPPGTPPGHDGGAGDGWTPPPVPTRRRSLLTRVTLGLALVTVGVLWSLRVADVLDVNLGWGKILSAALLVIGLGVLVGSVIGRARPLVVAGVVLLPIVVLSQVVSPWADGRAINLPGLFAEDGDGRVGGAVHEAPTRVDQVAVSYEMGIGSVRLDLRDLDLNGDSVATTIESGVGEVRVFVPEDAEVSVQAESGIGEVDLFDRERSSGFGAERHAIHSPDDPVGRIDLDLSVGIGSIQVDLVAGPDRVLSSESTDGSSTDLPSSDLPSSDTPPDGEPPGSSFDPPETSGQPAPDVPDNDG